MANQEKMSFYSKAIMSEPQIIEQDVSPLPSPSEKMEPQITQRTIDPSPTPSEKLDHKRSSMMRIQSVRARRKHQQKPLLGDRFARACLRMPLVVKVFLVVALSGLPFFIFLGLSYTTYKGREINNSNQLHVTYSQLAMFLSIAWASLLIIYALAEGFGKLGRWGCGLSKKSVRYAPLAQTMCFRLTMIAWVGACHLTMCEIWPLSTDSAFKTTWTFKLREAFMFLTVAFTIIFLQGLFLQLIAIQYVGGYIGPRAQRASDELEVIQELNSLIKPHVAADDLGYFTKMLRKIFMPVEQSTFDDIRAGRCEEDQVKGYADRIWNTIAGNKRALTASDIVQRLAAMGRDTEKGEELFILLDESCDLEVTREELENLVVKTATQLRKRAAAMKGIQKLLGKLEFLLTIVMFGLIIFVYTQFFNQNFAKNVAALWSGLTGLGFAIGGAVTEFVNSCVFVFAKHAYDVGDFVQAKGMKLVVTDVHLTHTNFEQVDDPEARGKVVQISHAALTGEGIVNWTRSNDALLEEELEHQKAVAAGAAA